MKKKESPNKSPNKGKKRKQNSRRIMVMVLAMVAVALIGGGAAFAKYYSTNHREGVSVASGLYFDSNRLVTKPGQVTDLDAMAAEDVQGLPVNVNTTKWSGGSTTFDIEVRNYENHLLYNDASLEIGYEIRFYLLDVPGGANYYVQKTMEESSRVALYEENADGTIKTPVTTRTFSGTLPGGTLSTDSYTLIIDMVNEERYNKKQARVLAVAYPISPDYVRNDSNQQNRLMGVFQGSYSQIALSVDSAGFKVQQETDYNDKTWKSKVEDLSGLIYNVKTKGDIVTDEGDSITVKPQVIIKWKTKYLQISEYDAYYQKALAEQDGVYTDGQWTCMRVSAMPYTSIDVTFYQTEAFQEELANGTLRKADFEGLVNAKAITN